MYPPFVSDNRAVNGDFLIDQPNEFSSITPAATGYVNDTWKFETAGLGSALTFQVVKTGGFLGAAQFPNSFLITTAVNTAPTAAQYSAVSHAIEGANIADFNLGTQNAKSFTVSFVISASVTGTYYVHFRNSALTRSYVTPVICSTGYNIFTITIPGHITGTWLSGVGQVGLWVGLDLGAGANFQTTANTWGAGNFTSVSGAVKLVNNTAATLRLSNLWVRPSYLQNPLDYAPRHYAQELAFTQRYYNKTFVSGTKPAQNAGVTGAITVKNPIASGNPAAWWQFGVPMANTPTITTYNPSAANANWRDITAAADVTVSVDPSSTKGTDGVIIATSAAVTTAADILAIHAVADARL